MMTIIRLMHSTTRMLAAAGVDGGVVVHAGGSRTDVRNIATDIVS